MSSSSSSTYVPGRKVNGGIEGNRKLKIHPSIHLLIPHQGHGGRWRLSSALHTDAAFISLEETNVFRRDWPVLERRFDRSSVQSDRMRYRNRYLKTWNKDKQARKSNATVSIFISVISVKTFLCKTLLMAINLFYSFYITSSDSFLQIGFAALKFICDWVSFIVHARFWEERWGNGEHETHTGFFLLWSVQQAGNKAKACQSTTYRAFTAEWHFPACLLVRSIL